MSFQQLLTQFQSQLSTAKKNLGKVEGQNNIITRLQKQFEQQREVGRGVVQDCKDRGGTKEFCTTAFQVKIESSKTRELRNKLDTLPFNFKSTSSLKNIVTELQDQIKKVTEQIQFEIRPQTAPPIIVQQEINKQFETPLSKLKLSLGTPIKRPPVFQLSELPKLSITPTQTQPLSTGTKVLIGLAVGAAILGA